MELIISKEEINTEELRRNLEEYENATNVAEQATNEKDEAEDKLLESAGKDPTSVMRSWLQYQCHDETRSNQGHFSKLEN